MEKISGIYRLFIKLNKQEYSYVGVSKNINLRIRTHFNEIKKNLNHKNDFGLDLQDHNIPVNGAFYWKIAAFLIVNKLTFDDVKWEVLELKNFDKVDDIEDEETELITKFNAILQGFNGAFSKNYKYQFGIKYAQGTPNEKILKDKLMKENLQIEKYAKLIQKNSEICLPWVSWQILIVNFEKTNISLKLKKNEVIEVLERWIDFCDSAMKEHYHVTEQYDEKLLLDFYKELKKIKETEINLTLKNFGFKNNKD